MTSSSSKSHRNCLLSRGRPGLGTPLRASLRKKPVTMLNSNRTTFSHSDWLHADIFSIPTRRGAGLLA